MGTTKLIGLILLAGGIICMTIAYQQSDSAGDQVSHFFTGDYQDKTVWLGIVGVVAAVLGLGGVFAPSRKG
jgi:hypothetical protein